MNDEETKPYDPATTGPELDTALIAATYQAVRNEIQIVQIEYMSGMKYALFGSAAIYAWLFTLGDNATDNVVSYAWWIPLALTIFIAVKAILAARHIFNISEFVRIQYAEKFERPEDCWEVYLVKRRKENRFFALSFAFLSGVYWIGLLGANVLIPSLLSR